MLTLRVFDITSGWCTHRPCEVCTSRVMKVDVAGQMQFRASMAYLNSSSQTM